MLQILKMFVMCVLITDNIFLAVTLNESASLLGVVNLRDRVNWSCSCGRHDISQILNLLWCQLTIEDEWLNGLLWCYIHLKLLQLCSPKPLLIWGWKSCCQVISDMSSRLCISRYDLRSCDSDLSLLVSCDCQGRLGNWNLLCDGITSRSNQHLTTVRSK